MVEVLNAVGLVDHSEAVDEVLSTIIRRMILTVRSVIIIAVVIMVRIVIQEITAVQEVDQGSDKPL